MALQQPPTLPTLPSLGGRGGGPGPRSGRPGSPAGLTPPPAVPTTSLVSPPPETPAGTIGDYIRQQATVHGIDPRLALAMVQQESGGRIDAVSPKGARGLFQLMPATAAELGVNPDDPFENIDGGLRYFKQQLDRFDGDVRLALAAYNAGPSRVAEISRVPDIPETQNYVRSILTRWQQSTTPPPPPAPETLAREESSKPSGIQSANDFLAFLNRGIAEGLTFGTATDPLVGGMQRLGIAASEEAPETVGEHTARGMGVAAGTLPGLAVGGLTLAARGVGMTAAIARQLLSPFLRAPATALTAEVAAGAGAGAGRGIAEESGHPELAPLAELAGGMGAGVIAGSRVAQVDDVRRAIQTARSRLTQAIFPFTRAGATPRASAQLQGRVPNPAEAAALGGGSSIGNLTPAQRTGDDNLIALERVLAERSTQASQQFRERLVRSEQALREAAEDMGNVRGLEHRVEAATRRADERLQSLSPERSAEQSSQILHQELQQSLKAARATESKLWDIPNVRVPTTETQRTFARLVADLPPAQADDMPAVATRLYGRPKTPDPEDVLLVGPQGETLVTRTSEGQALADSDSLRNLHGFYSQMREAARLARASGRFNQARLSDELADAAWSDLTQSADVPTAVGELLNAARAYSSEVNRVFRRGGVGEALGFAREGGRRLDPRELLEAVIGGRGTTRAAVTADELQEAVSFAGGDVAASTAAVEDVLKRRFLAATHFDLDQPGVFSAAGGRAFLRNNQALLTRFPDLERQLQSTLVSMDAAQTLNTARQSVARALRAESPNEAFGRLRQSLPASDQPALRGALIEHGLMTQRLDVLGNPQVSGARLLNLLRGRKTRDVFTQMFGRGGTLRLEQIARELAHLDKATGQAAPTIPGTEVLEPPGMGRTTKALTYIVGTIGARLGAFVGNRSSGASLRTASRTARIAESGLADFMNRHATQLVIDALDDPALFKALMTPISGSDLAAGTAEFTLATWRARTMRALGTRTQTLGVPSLLGTGAEMADAPDRLLGAPPPDVPTLPGGIP